MKITIQLFLCCVIGLVLASSAMAQKRKQSQAWGVPQVFSSLSYGKESGDIGGMEVILIPGDGEFWATVMIAEGVPQDPVTVKTTTKGTNVEFTLPGDGSYAGKFKGKISPAGLTLWSPSGERLGLLKRQSCP